MSISNRLAHLMARRKISQRELEDLSGIPQATISRMIRGKSLNPTLDILKRISTTLGCTIDYLVGEPELEEILANDLKAQSLLKIYGNLDAKEKQNVFAFASYLSQKDRPSLGESK